MSERDSNPVHHDNRIYHWQIIGFNVLFIVFADSVTWLARCLLTHHDVSGILMQSYVATSTLKLNTSILPEVFGCCTKLEKVNDVGSSNMLMERLPGRMLDLQDVMEVDEQYRPTLAGAKKVSSVSGLHYATRYT